MRVAVYDSAIVRLVAAHERDHLTSRSLSELRSTHRPLADRSAAPVAPRWRPEKHMSAITRDCYVVSTTSRTTEFADLYEMLEQARATTDAGVLGMQLHRRYLGRHHLWSPTRIPINYYAESLPNKYADLDPGQPARGRGPPSRNPIEGSFAPGRNLHATNQIFGIDAAFCEQYYPQIRTHARDLNDHAQQRPAGPARFASSRFPASFEQSGGSANPDDHDEQLDGRRQPPPRLHTPHRQSPGRSYVTPRRPRTPRPSTASPQNIIDIGGGSGAKPSPGPCRSPSHHPVDPDPTMLDQAHVALAEEKPPATAAARITLVEGQGERTATQFGKGRDRRRVLPWRPRTHDDPTTHDQFSHRRRAGGRRESRY